MNKKGFTLIELLAIILMIGIVMAISIVGVTSYINKGKEKGILITRTNVLSSAQDYAKEYYNDNDWLSMQGDLDKESSCVSIEQLKSAGYIDKKVNDEGIEYIILKRNKNTMVITDKHFVDGSNNDESEFCRITRTIIKNPSFKTYTNHIEANYKISSIGEKGNGITISSRSISINYKEKDSLDVNSISVFNASASENDDFDNLNFELDQLKHNTEYIIDIEITYNFEVVNNEGEKEDSQQTVTYQSIVKTSKLKVPVINVENENKIRKEKKITIKYDTTKIYLRENEYPGIYFSSTTNIKDFSLGMEESLGICDSEKFDEITNCNLIEDVNTENLSSDNIYKLKTLNDLIVFTVSENETTVEAILSDGINTVSSTKEIKNIDDHEYTCNITKVNNSNNTISINVVDNTNPSNKIGKDIVTSYKWDGDTKYKEYNGSDGIIAQKQINRFGEYKAYVKLRTTEVLECSGKIEDASNPSVNIVARRNNVVLTDTANNWYNGSIDVDIYTESSNSYISYCITESDSCKPEEYETSSSSFQFTKTGKYNTGTYKIIANARNINNNNNNNISSDSSIVINIDNTAPTEPEGIVREEGKNTDITSNFYDNPNTWVNYKVTFSDFSAVDNGIKNNSTIDKIVWTRVNGDSCSGPALGELKSDSISKYGDGTSKAFCLKAIDKAGNESPWSTPYYFNIDKQKPQITIKAYRRKEGGDSIGLPDGEAVASVVTTSEATISSYANAIYGWLNKENYPYGIIYEVEFSDNVGLASKKWQYNPSNLEKDSASVNTYTTGGSQYTGSISGITGEAKVALNGEGYRKAKYIVRDIAGNETIVNIIAPMDKTPPKTYIIDIDASLKKGVYNPLNKISESTEEIYYTGVKLKEGELDYEDGSCMDKNFETGKYTIGINGDNQQVIWNLNATSSHYKKESTNTGSNWVNYSTYIANNPLEEKRLSFFGAIKGETVDYKRRCKDRAGNWSKNFHLVITVG